MKIYVAHNFAARFQLRVDLVELLKAGHDVTSRWIYDDTRMMAEMTPQSAQIDVDDIIAANVVLLFVDQYGTTPGRGKYWEWGYIIGVGKPLILVGSGESCIFYQLDYPGIHKVSTLTDAIALIESGTL